MRSFAVVGMIVLLAAAAAGPGRAQEPPAPAPGPDAEARLAEQEARLRRLEAELEALRRERPAPATSTEPAPPPATSTAPAPGAGAPPAAEAAPVASGAAAADGPLPGSVTMKIGEGVRFTAADDSFSVFLRGRIQLRYTHTDREGEDPSDGFQVRRARLTLGGHLLTRDLTWQVQLAFSNQDTEKDLRLVLRDAYGDWKVTRDLVVRFGQMKVPFDRQRVISSANQQLVDRSIVVAELNLDRDVGVQVYSTDLFGLGKLLRYHVGVFGGDGRNRLATTPGLLVVGRLEVTPLGAFESYEEADLARCETPKLAVGAAAAYNSNTNRDKSTFGDEFTQGRVDYRHAEADLIFKWAGFSFECEAILRETGEARLFDPTRPGPVETTRSAWGYFVQSGYLFTERFEVAGRFGELRPVKTSAVVHQYEAGGGLSYYLHGHDVKVQADYFHLWGTHFADGTDEGRVQVQLAF